VKDQDYKPTGVEKLFAQWPAFVSLVCFAAAGGYFWYAKTHAPHVLYVKPLLLLIAGGVVSLGYWSLAS
jgi:hypothetical protein